MWLFVSLFQPRRHSAAVAGNPGSGRCHHRPVQGAHIVAGGETELLHVHVHRLMEDRTDIVLHLGDVVFIDSSGLGMLVRLLISMRKNGGDLKLCNVPPDIHKVLKMTNLNTLFAMHESEEDAISAFYRRNATSEPKTFDGPRLLCVDPSADVLAYLRELLRRAGYNVLTNSNLHDSLILIRATQPGLVIVGPNLRFRCWNSGTNLPRWMLVKRDLNC